MSIEPPRRDVEIRALLDVERRRAGKYQDMQRMLIRYAVERLLYRLGLSPYGNKFVLKGALLLAVYLTDGYRSTGDGDLTAYGRYTPEELTRIFREVCEIEHDDGLMFDAADINVQQVGAEREYAGFTISIPAMLGASRCNVRLDVGIGQAVTPKPPLVDFPSLLDLPKPRIRIYPLETIVAEKFHAIVHLGISNTRLKDYYDVSEIALRCTVNGTSLSRAIAATFKRRRTKLPVAIPDGLTSDYYEARDKQAEWTGFLKRHNLRKQSSLKDAVELVARLVMPAVTAALAEIALEADWYDQGWHARELSAEGAASK